MVIASRQIANSVNEEDIRLFRPRKWAVTGLAYLASLLWRKEGNRVYDVLHGFKGWKKTAFVEMSVLDHGLSIDLEMVARSYKLKMKRAEFHATKVVRHYGEAQFKIWPTEKKLSAYISFELFRND